MLVEYINEQINYNGIIFYHRITIISPNWKWGNNQHVNLHIYTYGFHYRLVSMNAVKNGGIALCENFLKNLIYFVFQSKRQLNA